MLSLVLVLALGECGSDTDCKGDRICVGGECTEPYSQRYAQPRAREEYLPLPAVVTPPRNPWKVHIWVSMAGAIASWLVTGVGSLAIGDVTFPTTVIPVVGPVISALTCTPARNCTIGGTGYALLTTSTVLQVGFFAYLLTSIIMAANYTP